VRTAQSDAVRSCYAAWSPRYLSEYYGPKASYPPVHAALLKRLLAEAKVKTVLDAGCGPASLLRELVDEGIEGYGFDLTPEMVAEARKVLRSRGIPPSRLWTGSVLNTKSFRVPGVQFDAVICMGVLPHIPERRDVEVIRNLKGAVRQGGWVILQARNQLFSLFALNRPTFEFFVGDLIPKEALGSVGSRKRAEILGELRKRFRMDLPSIRGRSPGTRSYDETNPRAHNPFVLANEFARAGLTDVRTLFYHYHALPPMLDHVSPAAVRRASLAMENPEDWRGTFMASAFVVVGRRA
jgi:2-polyprenyl-3-methyl-5-hydroxy-6-metoxy-1,4-benzoquinol methylase